MTVVKTIADCRAARQRMGTVAFVPTMGALHEGHLTLIRTARQFSRDVVVSIFVNPTQFGPREDLARYPRPFEQDAKLAEDAGASVIYAPEPAEMYRENEPKVLIDFPELTSVLEGKHRPGHFQGVLQVVAKLFNIVQPQYACFGQKDFQQLRIILAMTQALDFPINIVPCPTLREPDGLAMSSRNRYLSSDERLRALSISRALFACQEEAKNTNVASKLTAIMHRILRDVGQLGHVPMSIDYFACVDPDTLRPVDTLDQPVICAIAARVGQTRLIDNVLIEPNRA